MNKNTTFNFCTLLVLLSSTLSFAQVDSMNLRKVHHVKKNEISINAFELILGGVLPINYERFINKNQSIGIKTFLFDNHYNNFFDKSNKSTSIQANYIFYFNDKKQNAGFFVSPFLKYTHGQDYRYDYYNYNYDGYGYYYYSNNGTKIYVNNKSEKIQFNSIIAGLGLGYKFLWKNKVSFSINTDLGRVLNYDEEKFYNYASAVEFRAGLNLGFRF